MVASSNQNNNNLKLVCDPSDNLREIFSFSTKKDKWVVVPVSKSMQKFMYAI